MRKLRLNERWLSKAKELVQDVTEESAQAWETPQPMLFSLLPCGWSCLIPTLHGSDGTGSCPPGMDRRLWSHLRREPHRGNRISTPSPHHGHKRSKWLQRLCHLVCVSRAASQVDSPSEVTAGEILPLGSSRQQSHLHLNSLQTWCYNKSSREVGNKWTGFEGSSQCHELLWAHYTGYFI